MRATLPIFILVAVIGADIVAKVEPKKEERVLIPKEQAIHKETVLRNAAEMQCQQPLFKLKMGLERRKSTLLS